MKIAKFGHSCLLVEAASGARILVDPGSYSDIPPDVLAGRIDAVLITHRHEDHLDLPLMRLVEAAHPGILIYGCSDAVAPLLEVGIAAVDHAHKDFEVAGMAIEMLEAGHEAILGIAPVNSAYRIDGEIVITGDSASVALDAWEGTRVLALPTIAPWTTEVAQGAFLERMKPAVSFSVHDGFLIDSYRERAQGRFKKFAAERGIQFITLGPELTQI